MKKLFVAFLSICAFAVSAQESRQENTTSETSFYAELGGPGILFSANLDKRFNKTRLGWGGRVGVGFVTTSDYEYITQPGGGGYYGNYRQVSVATFPLQVNYIFGKSNSPHTFEVGGGVTIAGRKIDIFDNFDDQGTNSVFGTASFMYRRQPIDGGFSWRIGFTPIIGSGYIQPSAGVSVGYNF